MTTSVELSALICRGSDCGEYGRYAYGLVLPSGC